MTTTPDAPGPPETTTPGEMTIRVRTQDLNQETETAEAAISETTMSKDQSNPEARRRRRWLPVLVAYTAGLATVVGFGIGSRMQGTETDTATVTAPVAPWSTASGSTASGSTAAGSTAPRSTPGAGRVPASPSATAVPEHSLSPLGAELRAQVEPLQQRLAHDPEDLVTRKRLAVLLVRNNQLMMAYDQASAILRRKPDDPDGLYVHGVVRLAMGHTLQALRLLDRVVTQVPDHVLAHEARAEAQRRIGDQQGAVESASRARQGNRGGDPAVEELIAAASQGRLAEQLGASTGEGDPEVEGGTPW